MNEKRAETEYFIRMTLSQRIQHAAVIVAFMLLVITGFPLRFANSSVSQWLVNVMGGYEARAILHRVAAVLLIAVTLYHFISIIVGYFRNRRQIHEQGFFNLPMVWNRKDWDDIRQTIAYYTRADTHPPRYGKYSYVEKIEYWSFIWGSAVMILSGLILWFPFKSLAVFPTWLVNVALVVHSYEATLAIISIVIWHWYTVHLSPDHFPMNWSWITGTVSAEEMKEHHPLEYERLMREKQMTDDE